jgi:hypothetical protein
MLHEELIDRIEIILDCRFCSVEDLAIDSVPRSHCLMLQSRRPQHNGKDEEGNSANSF